MESINVTAGNVIPGDREYALARSDVSFDPIRPKYIKKTNFLALINHAELITLKTNFDPISKILTIRKENKLLARANLSDPIHREEISKFFAQSLGIPLEKKPHLVRGEEGTKSHSFSDVPKRAISLINLTSNREFSEKIGTKIDPIRYRGNLYFENDSPWDEFNWIDRKIQIGNSVLQVFSRIQRCAATNVNPSSGARDINIPKELNSIYNHVDMGVYAQVIQGGKINNGDAIQLI